MLAAAAAAATAADGVACADEELPGEEQDHVGSSSASSGSTATSTRRRLPRYCAEQALLNMLRPKKSEIEDLLALFWFPAALFAAAELVALCGIRKSFFEAITDGAFELGPRFEAIVEVHVWASAVMWVMAAVQILCECVRKSPDLAWAHRRTGQAMLGLFYAVVLPTSLYLTVMQRIEWLSLAVAAVLLDTAVCTSYFLYRGWRVARLRRNSKSLSLHGRLMQCGVVMSMSILPQRLLQLYLTMQLKNYHQLNYTVSILITSILFVIFGHFLDGPRGGIWMACIGAEHAEEAYGSAPPSKFERWLWRLRWLLYALLYKALNNLCRA